MNTWWDFVKKNYKVYYVQLLKVLLTQVAAAIGMLIIICLIGVTAYFGVTALNLTQYWMWLLGIGAIAAIIAIVAMNWIQRSILFTEVTITDAMLGGRQLGIAKSFSDIKWRTLRYVITDIVVRIVVFLPALILLALPFLSFVVLPKDAAMSAFIMLFMVAFMAAWLYYIVALIAYAFLLQFWPYGFLIEGLSVKDSLKKSYRIARSRPFDVLVFDIVLLALSWTATIPMMVFYMLAYFAIIFLQIILIFLPLAGIAAILACIVIMAIVSVFFSALIEMVRVPLHYLFWKKLK